MEGHAAPAAVVGVTIAMVILAAFAVGARLYARLVLVKNAGIDDAFITAALTFSVATTITMCLQVKYGMGQHIYNLTLQDGVESQKPFYVSIWVYNLSMSCTKFSILLQYLRIFPQVRFRHVCHIMIGVVAVYTAWTFFSAVFACWPIEYFWTQVGNPNGKGHCLNRFAVWFANAGMNIATDMTVGLLPIPVIRELELPKRQKIALMLVFGLGLFTCVVSILRLQALYVIRQNFDKDVTYHNPLAAIWSSVEINTGILCSCLPTLRRLFSKWFPNLLDTVRSSGAAGSGREARSADAYSARKPSTDASKQLTASSANSRGMSHDALGKGLTGKGQVTQTSYAYSRNDDSSEEMLELDAIAGAPQDDHGIQVTTVVEQDVEKLSGGWCEDRDTDRLAHEGRGDLVRR